MNMFRILGDLPSTFLNILLVIFLIFVFKNIGNRTSHRSQPPNQSSQKPRIVPPRTQSAKTSFAMFAYEPNPRFLSDNEKAFYRELVKVLPQLYVICIKVRAGDLLSIRSSVDFKKEAFWEIAQKHLDYVILNKITLEPVLVIELDDSTHTLPERKKRDEFLNAVFSSRPMEKLLFVLESTANSMHVQDSLIVHIQKKLQISSNITRFLAKT